MPGAGSVAEAVARVPHWRHRIVLPGDVITPGSQDTLAQLDTIGLPDDLSGKTVLDIGCSDGFYSFECERRGAARVLAIDDFSSVYVDAPSGFQTAHEILGSNVEYRRLDLFDLDREAVGGFDLVLFLGVLYHLRHPLLALEKIGPVCDGQLIVETVITETASRRWWRRGADAAETSMQFFEGDEVNRDPTTWWAPTAPCLEAMLRSCGYCGVSAHHVSGSRGIFHAFHPGGARDEVLAFLRGAGEASVAEACESVLGSAPSGDLEEVVARLDIAAFGAIKQHVACASARRWHQDERWRAAGRRSDG